LKTLFLGDTLVTSGGHGGFLNIILHISGGEGGRCLSAYPESSEGQGGYFLSAILEILEERKAVS
jgi:hypothetical protein